MNRILIGVVVLAAHPMSIRADELLRWLPADGKPNVIVHPAGKLAAQPVVQVTGGAGPTITRILEIDQPKVPSYRYVLRGRIKYENVEGPAFVEMLNFFGDEGVYFTRTLSEAGPLARLTGTSDWREIELPFTSKPGLLPSKLTVSVHLPGKGSVYLEALTLSSLAGEVESWWTEEQAAWGGAIGGSLCGLLGAIIGTLAGMGLARGFVLPMCTAIVCAGAVSLVAGCVAVAMGQPYQVFYPLLLFGGIDVFVFGLNLPNAKRRYDELELRKMTALDA